MFVIIGLVILIAAVVIGVAGVLSNAGSNHAVGHGFAVFGYHVTGSTGTVFLYGIVVGGIAVLGLALLLAATRRTARRGRSARQGLKQSRQETAAVSMDRDELLNERDTARANGTALPQGSGAAEASRQDRHTGRPHLLGVWSKKKPVGASPPVGANRRG